MFNPLRPMEYLTVLVFPAVFGTYYYQGMQRTRAKFDYTVFIFCKLWSHTSYGTLGFCMATPVGYVLPRKAFCKVYPCASHVTMLTFCGKVGNTTVFPDCVEKYTFDKHNFENNRQEPCELWSFVL